MENVILKLYVSGRDPTTDAAANELQAYCERETSSIVQIEIIDVLESPEIAEQNRVLATPTLVKECPLPVRKVIGNFSDLARVTRFLGITNGVHRPETAGVSQ